MTARLGMARRSVKATAALDAPQFGSASREQTGGLPMTACVARPRIKESPQPA